MDPISNVDQIVLILRQRLQERARAAASKNKTPPGVSNARRPARLQSVRSLAAVEGVDDPQLRRTLVQNILSDQFGAELVNEAQFQQVVDQVTVALEENEQASVLLTRLVSELRAGAA
ncbi:MAG TPA: hypothetical protein VG407_07105 [Caulobacteraceae bacterium]|jgi:hypothetical protein|nr:hypothetical protein [Caulobacteraceae bacterium]